MLFVYMLFVSSHGHAVTELMPITITTSITAFIFSLILAASPLRSEHNKEDKFPFKLALKEAVYGLIASIIVSSVTALYLMYGLSQIIGASIGLLSFLIYWYLPYPLSTRTFKLKSVLSLFPVAIISAFIYLIWPLAETYTPSLAYPFGTWDARKRMENSVARSINIGDNFSDYRATLSMMSRLGGSSLGKEFGFTLGSMPTYSYCVKDGVIKKIWIFENDENISVYSRCDID